MEKSIENSLDGWIQKVLGIKELDVQEYSPLALAYIGDCVYDLIIKTWIMSGGNRQV